MTTNNPIAFNTKKELLEFSNHNDYNVKENTENLIKFIQDNAGKFLYLRGANLEGANLEDANLEGANLEGANLGSLYNRVKNTDYLIDGNTTLNDIKNKIAKYKQEQIQEIINFLSK